MATFSLNDGLDASPELLAASLDKVFGHLVPLVLFQSSLSACQRFLMLWMTPTISEIFACFTSACNKSTTRSLFDSWSETDVLPDMIFWQKKGPKHDPTKASVLRFRCTWAENLFFLRWRVPAILSVFVHTGVILEVGQHRVWWDHNLDLKFSLRGL